MFTIKKRMLAVILAAILAIGAFGGAMAFAAIGVPGDGFLGGNAVPPDYTNPDIATKLSPTPQENIWVTVIFEAGDSCYYDDDEYDWILYPGTSWREEIYNYELGDGSTKSLYTVSDLLLAIDADATYGDKFTFWSQYNGLIPFANDPSYLYQVDYSPDGTSASTHSWAGNLAPDSGDALIPTAGWVFRTLDQSPVYKDNEDSVALDENYNGNGVAQTYLSNGDIIHFFFDNPAKVTASIYTAANYTRAKYASNDANTLTVQVQSHDTYIDQTTSPYWTMNVNNYVDFTGYQRVGAYLYAMDGTTLLSRQIIDPATGLATFNYTVAPGETYIVKTDSQLLDITDDTWEDWINDSFFLYTGAYSKIVIPSQPVEP
jgi:hypothetical protein